MTVEERSRVLRSRGVESDSVLAELLTYTHSPYLDNPGSPNEARHDTFWRDFLASSQDISILARLEQIMPQLRFPVRPGMRSDAEYRKATLRGENGGTSGGVGLKNPSDFRLRLHDAGCGFVPVLLPRGRDDFRTLVQAISGRNEPIEVPDSMGACVVSGYNNWGRIEKLKARFTAEYPFGNWAERFAEIRKSKELYSDEIFIVSDGPYSGVLSAELELDSKTWSHASSQIRLHHESFHLFCRRVYGLMQSNALDETFADYVGLVRATGRFDKQWFFLFMGLEAESYRQGGRLENYCQELSGPAFEIVCGLTRDAGHSLSRLGSRLETLSAHDQMRFLLRHDLVDVAEERFR